MTTCITVCVMQLPMVDTMNVFNTDLMSMTITLAVHLLEHACSIGQRASGLIRRFSSGLIRKLPFTDM